MPIPPKQKITLSFSGCGFLAIYHVGVASCFREFEEQFEIERIAGASAGAIGGAVHLSGCCLGKATTDVVQLAAAARASPVGPLSPRFNIVRSLRAGLRKTLPDDAHLLCSGRLSVSLTRCSDGKNLMVSHFGSKEELIEVLLCSSFIPLYSGLVPPYYKDGRYWDGGISNNLPVFDPSTVTVSPFSGESDICPSDKSAQSFMEMSFGNQNFRINSTNAYRLTRAFFPPHPDHLKEICEEGYRDALRYIKNTLLHCRLPDSLVFSEPQTPLLSPTEEREVEEIGVPIVSVRSEERAVRRRINLERINALLEKYSSDNPNLPITVIEALRGARRSTPHPVVQILSYAALPWILPLEFAYSTCIRLIELTPMPRNMELQYYIEVFSSIAQRVVAKILSRHGGSAWVQCNCKVETVSGNRCVLHGKAVINQSHSLTFAFAIVEESPPICLSSSSASSFGSGNSTLPFSFQLPAVEPAKSAHAVAETAVLISDIRWEDGAADMLAYEESCDIVERFEREISDYFQAQIPRQSIGTTPF
ncbi:Patatin-like phospholipase domain-containing protein 2 [Hypsibius exemplaris]|uniref:triacylglycerol lipase n=1 Tax=Hypsibius exemplaris TaxID=2072580 RepID=A0A1W0XBG7_HYPEX|nr:Patatin-like phospholipase domain-containing protein 2 [Hypsibius exemplaris]